MKFCLFLDLVVMLLLCTNNAVIFGFYLFFSLRFYDFCDMIALMLIKVLLVSIFASSHPFPLSILSTPTQHTHSNRFAQIFHGSCCEYLCAGKKKAEQEQVY